MSFLCPFFRFKTLLIFTQTNFVAYVKKEQKSCAIHVDINYTKHTMTCYYEILFVMMTDFETPLDKLKKIERMHHSQFLNIVSYNEEDYCNENNVKSCPELIEKLEFYCTPTIRCIDLHSYKIQHESLNNASICERFSKTRIYLQHIFQTVISHPHPQLWSFLSNATSEMYE
jgi:hypothetical protein